MLIKCNNCGAPLDVGERQYVVTCAYCQHTQRVGKPPGGIHATPADWRAPKQWTPPPKHGGPLPGGLPNQPVGPPMGQPLVYDPHAAARKTFGVMSLLGLLPVLIPVIVVGGIFFGPRLEGWMWDGSETLVCGGNDSGTISGKKLTVKAKPGIEVRGNCKMTLEDVELTGEELFEVRENGRLTIENSQLTVEGKEGIEVDGNFGVQIRGGRLRIEGDGKKVEALITHGNTDVEARDTVIEIDGDGAEVIVAQSDGNGGIELRDVELKIENAGRTTLYEMSSNGAFKMEGGSIEAKGTLYTKSRRDSTVDDVELKGARIER